MTLSGVRVTSTATFVPASALSTTITARLRSETLATSGIRRRDLLDLHGGKAPKFQGAQLRVADVLLCTSIRLATTAISSWILWKACRPSSVDGCGIIAASLMALARFCSVLENIGAARRM
jgi:hypothetical protein